MTSNIIELPRPTQAEILKRIRKESSLDYFQFAERLSVTVADIDMYENGLCSLLRWLAFTLIAFINDNYIHINSHEILILFYPNFPDLRIEEVQ